MKIKNVEERTGLSRSNVRFYEKEKLIEPSRNESKSSIGMTNMQRWISFGLSAKISVTWEMEKLKKWSHV